MKLTIAKWLFYWAVIGLLVPTVLLLRWKLLGVMFGEVEAALWPASIITMGLEGNSTIWNILLIYAIAFVVNVLLYSLIGLLIWPVLRFFVRQQAEHPEPSRGTH